MNTGIKRQYLYQMNVIICLYFRKGYNISFPMQFLKQKALSVYNFSQILRKKDLSSEQGGKSLLLQLLDNPKIQISYSNYQQISKASNEPQQYTQIFNLLIDRLEDFQYRAKFINAALKLLNIVGYLLKNGHQQFVRDFSKNEDIIVKYEQIDTHHFEGEFGKNTKQVTYNLEMIRHKAMYIRKLLHDGEFRAEERRRQLNRERQEQSGKIRVTGEETVNGLVINGSVQTSPIKDIPEKLQLKDLIAAKENNKQQESLACFVTKPNLKASSVLGNKVANSMSP